jgi:hypothetical protein
MAQVWVLEFYLLDPTWAKSVDNMANVDQILGHHLGYARKLPKTGINKVTGIDCGCVY